MLFFVRSKLLTGHISRIKCDYVPNVWPYSRNNFPDGCLPSTGGIKRLTTRDPISGTSHPSCIGPLQVRGAGRTSVLPHRGKGSFYDCSKWVTKLILQTQSSLTIHYSLDDNLWWEGIAKYIKSIVCLPIHINIQIQFWMELRMAI